MFQCNTILRLYNEIFKKFILDLTIPKIVIVVNIEIKYDCVTLDSIICFKIERLNTNI